jgi:GDP-4-dehydro-6-deoxy-D-mannose reductase
VRTFVTGGTGFVGRWLVDHLREAGDDVVVADPDLEITDEAGVRAAVVGAMPEAVYHLAALAHVGQSWADPARTFSVNALGTLCLLSGARACTPAPRVVLIGSAEVYGAIDPSRLPVGEDTELQPVTPYAASKAAAELLAIQAYLGYHLPVVRTRPFNKIGPGQDASFVVSAIAQRVARAERDGFDTLRVGNLAARRDFLDVRDAVRAYRLLSERGEPGEVYNVCSGHDVAVEELAVKLMALAGVDLRLEVDPALARPVDVPRVVGDPSRLTAATGWTPEIPLDRTLADVLAWWRQAVAAEEPVG